MTQQELIFSKFERLYTYDYQANEDGNERTVIFSFWAKENPDKTFIKYEAKSLEKAFIYAFVQAKMVKYSQSGLLVGDVFPVNHEMWNELVNRDRFWSLQDQCWKSKKACIAAEDAEIESRRLYFNK